MTVSSMSQVVPKRLWISCKSRSLDTTNSLLVVHPLDQLCRLLAQLTESGLRISYCAGRLSEASSMNLVLSPQLVRIARRNASYLLLAPRKHTLQDTYQCIAWPSTAMLRCKWRALKSQ